MRCEEGLVDTLIAPNFCDEGGGRKRASLLLRLSGNFKSDLSFNEYCALYVRLLISWPEDSVF